MAETFQFDLVAPSQLLLSEAVEEVVVPGSDGDFGILAGHAPFLATMRPGFISVKRQGAEERYFVRGGFADTTTEGLTILAEEAVAEGDLTAEFVDKAIKEAEASVEKARDEAATSAAQLRLSQLQAVRSTL
ncbi:MAG: F0F1 ATP synthase subunit epsilon [Pseudomonadota bacterium]